VIDVELRAVQIGIKLLLTDEALSLLRFEQPTMRGTRVLEALLLARRPAPHSAMLSNHVHDLLV
jgi:hypothetical protein